MSLWQRKNLHKRHLLWLRLYGLCFFFHCGVLVWVFFIHDNDSYQISLSLNKHLDYSAPILFVPITSSVTAPQPILVENIPAASSTPTEQPSVIKKEMSTKADLTTIAAPANTTVTKASVNPVEVKKNEVTKTIVPAKKEQKAPAQKPTPIKKEIPEQPIIKTTPHDLKQQIAPVLPENAHISHNYKEVEALRRNALLQKELINNWKPPVGMPSNTTCEISFSVDSHGTIKNSSITKSSGIMMYDISARHALFSMKMPQWTYEKTITINFTQ